MFRTALNRVGGHSETTAMIGDRMDTDVIAGVEAGLHTFLVLSGITQRDEVEASPFRPNTVVDSIKDLIEVAKTGHIDA
jgi:NagD protein